MSGTRGARRLPAWVKRALRVVGVLALTELLARVIFVAYLTYGPPPNCGLHPELLGRLIYAYSGGRYSMLPVGSHIAVADEHRGHRTSSGLEGVVVSGAKVFTNSIGARGQREYQVPKPGGVTRIVTIGDSMTFGEGVSDDAAWPAQLESALEGTEVVNLADRGYAHDQMYFALVDVGLGLDPDVVILGFFESDLFRDDVAYFCYEKPLFSRGPEGFRIDNVPVPTPAEVRSRYLLMPLLYATPKAVVDRLRETVPPGGPGVERATEIIDRMRRSTEQRGARFVIINLPEHVDAAPFNGGFFRDYCARTGSECVDPWPDFERAAGTDGPDERRRRFLRPHDIHYAHEGHAVIAAALGKHFTDFPVVRSTPPPRR